MSIGPHPSVPAPTGLFAATSDSSGDFGAPQLLADAQTATLPQPTGAAISSASALVAWAPRRSRRAHERTVSASGAAHVAPA
jgi:hypothetical protein